MSEIINGLTIGLAVFAILISLVSVALNLGRLNNLIIFYDPKPPGWRYWPWAWRFYREHGCWPI